MLKYFEYVGITLAKTIDQLSLTDQDMENTFSGELMPSVEGIQVGHLSLIHRALTGHEWPRYGKIAPKMHPVDMNSNDSDDFG